MANLNLTLAVGEVSVTSTKKTFCTVKAPANQRIVVKGFSVFGKGTSNTDTPVQVDFSLITTDGQTGTATAITAQPRDGDLAETPQGTYYKNYGTEPTTYGANQEMREIHPQTGEEVYYPLDQEIVLKGGTELGIRLQSNQSETMALNVIVQE